MYLSSSENFDADSLSRSRSASIEWTVSSTVAMRLFEVFGEPEIDLFASRLNKVVPNFISWSRDSSAVAVDAFSVSWQQFARPYAFPPISLMASVLDKLYYSQGTVLLLVFPIWPSQPWFPTLLHLLCSEIYEFSAQNLTSNGWKVPKWTMGAALVTSTIALTRAFLLRLSSSCPLQEGHLPGNDTTPSGFTLTSGADPAAWIPVKHLFPR